MMTTPWCARVVVACAMPRGGVRANEGGARVEGGAAGDEA